MTSPGPDRLVAGPQVGGPGPGWRRLARALLVGVSSSLVLLVASLATAQGWRPPASLPPLDVAPHPAVEPVDRHLPYAAVDRTTTTTASGARARVVRPRGAEGTIPGVVLVAGSGATTRDDLADEAEALARGGLAVLTYDKRRTGYSVLRRDYEELADDALAALDAVVRLPGVDPERVGLLGFSEGGWVVPLAAQRAPGRVAFTVLVSAPVVSPLDQAAWTLDRRLAATPPRVRAAAGAALASGRPLLRHLGTDVRLALAAAPQPTYAVWGAEDPTVPVRVAVGRFREATGERGRVEVVGGAGHRVPVASGWAERVSDWARRGYPADAVVRGAQPVAPEGLPTLPGTGFRTDPRPQLALSGLAALVAGLWPLGRRAPRRIRTSRRG